ncbi:MAG: hypothetical protein JO135_00735 [Candidatus Eremiobacteraeota bacterium]|nr:hypothetical protein [Candidatus Eremiobacteraeota bacterium]
MQTQRLELEAHERAAPAPARLEAASVRPAIPEIEVESPVLARDHAPWMRDGVAISERTRRVLDRVRPLVIRVFGFWDHIARSMQIAGHRISIDAAGCYRID